MSHFRDFKIKLQTKASEMIAREFENIKKMKADERSAEFIDILFDLEFFDFVFVALLSNFFVFSFDLNFVDNSYLKTFKIVLNILIILKCSLNVRCFFILLNNVLSL